MELSRSAIFDTVVAAGVFCGRMLSVIGITARRLHRVVVVRRGSVRAKLHYTDTVYEHRQRTKICQIPRS